MVLLLVLEYSMRSTHPTTGERMQYKVLLLVLVLCTAGVLLTLSTTGEPGENSSTSTLYCSHGQPLIRETAAARIAIVKKLI
jgi:hypothetical protein